MAQIDPATPAYGLTFSARCNKNDPNQNPITLMATVQVQMDSGGDQPPRGWTAQDVLDLVEALTQAWYQKYGFVGTATATVSQDTTLTAPVSVT